MTRTPGPKYGSLWGGEWTCVDQKEVGCSANVKYSKQKERAINLDINKD